MVRGIFPALLSPLDRSSLGILETPLSLYFPSVSEAASVQINMYRFHTCFSHFNRTFFHFSFLLSRITILRLRLAVCRVSYASKIPTFILFIHFVWIAWSDYMYVITIVSTQKVQAMCYSACTLLVSAWYYQADFSFFFWWFLLVVWVLVKKRIWVPGERNSGILKSFSLVCSKKLLFLLVTFDTALFKLLVCQRHLLLFLLLGKAFQLFYCLCV